MKAHKTEHTIRGTQRTLTWLVYDIKEALNHKYPSWKFENRMIAGLSQTVLEGCVVNKIRYTHEPYSDTYPY